MHLGEGGRSLGSQKFGHLELQPGTKNTLIDCLVCKGMLKMNLFYLPFYVLQDGVGRACALIWVRVETRLICDLCQHISCIYVSGDAFKLAEFSPTPVIALLSQHKEHGGF